MYFCHEQYCFDGTERGGNPLSPLLGKCGSLISGSCGCVRQKHLQLSEGFCLCLCVLKTTILAWLTSDSVLHLLPKSPLPSTDSVPCDPFDSVFLCLCFEADSHPDSGRKGGGRALLL